MTECNCFVSVSGDVESASFDSPENRFGTSVALTNGRKPYWRSFVTLASIFFFGIRRRMACFRVFAHRFFVRIRHISECKTRNGKRFVRKNARPGPRRGIRRRLTDVITASGERADLGTGRPAAANAWGIHVQPSKRAFGIFTFFGADESQRRKRKLARRTLAETTDRNCSSTFVWLGENGGGYCRDDRRSPLPRSRSGVAKRVRWSSTNVHGQKVVRLGRTHTTFTDVPCNVPESKIRISEFGFYPGLRDITQSFVRNAHGEFNDPRSPVPFARQKKKPWKIRQK